MLDEQHQPWPEQRQEQKHFYISNIEASYDIIWEKEE
jgi:hypothetical protein